MGAVTASLGPMTAPTGRAQTIADVASSGGVAHIAQEAPPKI